MSIVTPSYNQGLLIEKTIRSVLLQGYPNLEYIIIDGGSTDGTVQVIREYSPWLTYSVSEPHKGQSAVINRGFLHSTADILGWLNSDDHYMPGAIQKIAEASLEDLEAHVFVGLGRVINCNQDFPICKEPPAEINLELLFT